jgi:membrane-bound serine protease (ClpP class)
MLKFTNLRLLLSAMIVVLPASAAPKVVAVSVDSIIHPITTEIISHTIEEARAQNADAVLIRLNTPGGMIDASRRIAQQIVGSPVPVIAFVTPGGARAASAGFFLLEAGDVAAMAEGTNTGAASPVLLGQEMDPVMRKKVESDTSAFLRSIVERRGRNADMAAKTISEAKSFTDTEALAQRLIDLDVKNEADLLAQLDGREITRFDGRKQRLQLAGATIIEYQPSARERIVSAISDPNLAVILLVLGVLGIYVEFNSPGLVFPGVAGGICAILAFSALAVLPLNLTGVTLLLLALACFILEAKYTTHGVLGIGGAVSMVLGLLMLVEGPKELQIHPATAIGVTIPFAGITIFLATIALRARRNKVITGVPALLNEVGVARTPLSPAGKVFVHGEYWDAVSSQPVAVGTSVRVVGVQGLKLTVEPVS